MGLHAALLRLLQALFLSPDTTPSLFRPAPEHCITLLAALLDAAAVGAVWGGAGEQHARSGDGNTEALGAGSACGGGEVGVVAPASSESTCYWPLVQLLLTAMQDVLLEQTNTKKVGGEGGRWGG